MSHTQTRCERLQKITEQLDNEIHSKNEIISKSEAEMTKRNAIIERKQGVIDQYNKKLEQMIISAGVSCYGYNKYSSGYRSNNSSGYYGNNKYVIGFNGKDKYGSDYGNNL